MRLLLVVLLALDGIFARPADVQRSLAPGAEVQLNAPSLAPDPTAPCYDGTTGDPLTLDECLARGVDPAWTPDPAATPFDCQTLWDSGGASLDCPGPPEPTP